MASRVTRKVSRGLSQNRRPENQGLDPNPQRPRLNNKKQDPQIQIEYLLEPNKKEAEGSLKQWTKKRYGKKRSLIQVAP